MQYFLDGYRKGDPRIRPAAEGRGEDQPALPEEVDVLIVGTGPAGLLLAAQLSEFPEIVTRVVERAAGPLEVGRADGVNCRTVETFEAFGLAERMMAEAYWVNETRFWGPDPADPSRLKRFGRVQDVRDGLSEFPHLIVNQARLLDFLLEHMRNSPSRLRVDYGHEAIAVQAPTSDDEPVLVTLRRGDGSELSVRARYVVGCDGAHSAVRQSIGRVAQGYGADKAWGVMDLLAVTDFPDIRLKATIQSGDGGNILLIPREGGYLVRMYVDMGEIAADAWLSQGRRHRAGPAGAGALHVGRPRGRLVLGLPGGPPGHRQVRRRRRGQGGHPWTPRLHCGRRLSHAHREGRPGNERVDAGHLQPRVEARRRPAGP